MDVFESTIKNIEIQLARSAVNNAIRDGRLTKPSKCEYCGIESSALTGHHYDYSRPLDVEWLCSSCHAAAHASIRERAWKTLGGRYKRQVKAEAIK